MAHPVSPLAPSRVPTLGPIAGVRLAAVEAGIRYNARTDLMLAELAPGTAVAGVLTRSTMPGAPVDWCRECLPGGRARAVVVNSGNSNVFTGRAGREVVRRTAESVANLLSCKPEEVFISSTGVIGEPPPAERVLAALPGLVRGLAEDAWAVAARAIMTTDTFPKGATRETEIGSTKVRLNGFCKGSGMIAPDMATMLGYVFTDAALPAPVLQALLGQSNERSFNAITVDGDTSTNDTLLVLASGRAGNPLIVGEGTAEFGRLAVTVTEVAQLLAQAIVRDGEGATKFITIVVDEGATRKECFEVAKSIANSPLVKTAFFASDPNLGRILAAAGNAGIADLDPGRIGLHIGGVCVVENGGRAATYTEAQGQTAMKPAEITVRVTLGRGVESATVWTCDFSYDYVKINADYRS